MIQVEHLKVEDVTVAVALYNDVRTLLEQGGWSAKSDTTTPGYWWTHPDVGGTCSMSAAYRHLVLAQHRLRPF